MCHASHKSAISEIIRNRQITRLVHFTPMINALSIIEMNAIISRKRVNQLAIKAENKFLMDYVKFNDAVRLDKKEDHINLSIQHPNFNLMKKFKERFADCDVWCVFEISPECLLQQGVLFCIGNAASSSVRYSGTGSTPENFNAMFKDFIVSSNQFGARTISRLNLAPCFPTDPQAEVLIPNEISLSRVTAIYLEDSASFVRFRSAVSLLPNAPELKVLVCPELFNERPISNG